MTFFGSTANDAAFNAWMTDITDSTNRGKVEGVNSAMPLIAILVVFGGKMLVEGNENEWTIIFLTIGILILIVGIVGIFVIKEPKIEVKNESYFKNIFYGFRPSVVKKNKLLYIFLVGMMIFSISVQVFMPYLILYFTNTLKLENYVLVFAPAIVLAAAFTVFYGKFIDKYGFKQSSIISISIYLVGLLVLGIFTHTALVFIGTLFMMMGYLSLGACFNTSIRDNTPVDKIGLFQGIRIFVSVLIPMLIGPWIGSLISGTSSEGFLGVTDKNYSPKNLIFYAALVVGVFTYIIVLWVHNFKKKTGEENA
jgi:MFS family permease